MAKLTRRQLLLAGLGIGGVLSGLHELYRRRIQYTQQASLTETLMRSPQYVNQAVTNAIEGDAESTAEVERILSTLDLQSPTQPYDREMSKILIQYSRLATEQYLTGKFDLRFDGALAALPAYSDRLADYTQVASITGPETVNAEQRVEVDHNAFNDPLLEGANQLKDLVRSLSGQSTVIQWSYPVYWGFVLTGPRNHILVLRGTQRNYEWAQTVRARQVSAQEVPEFDFPGAIHTGFANIYAELSATIIAAAQQLDPAKPLFVSGHSLGSPLATLAALDIAQTVPALQEQLRLYTYAGPKLGNTEFAEAHSRLVPNNYRVVNLADSVTLLPPTKVDELVYVHLGEEWAFTTYTGDFGPSHFVSAYRAAVEAELEQLIDR
jgi:triacylglycerol lipase